MLCPINRPQDFNCCYWQMFQPTRYAAHLVNGSTYYYFLHVTVMVHMTSCPSVDSPGPNWYKLEAISQVMLTPVGTFLEPPWRYEARLCQNKDVRKTIANIVRNTLEHLKRKSYLMLCMGWIRKKCMVVTGNWCQRFMWRLSTSQPLQSSVFVAPSSTYNSSVVYLAATYMAPTLSIY